VGSFERTTKEQAVARVGLHADVVLSTQGGIGNQLFQWAFARRLESEGRRVLVDSVRCRGSRPFRIAPLVSPSDRLGRAVGLALVAAERASALRIAGLNPWVEPSGGGFHARFLELLPEHAYVRGYFQSPWYFTPVENDVRTSVARFLSGMLTPAGRSLAAELRDDPRTVAVHIRRGDYVSDPSAAAVHGTLQTDYYQRAVALAEEQGGRRRIWFSDDLPWVARTLARESDLLCPSGMTSSDGGEIALMSACRTRIIANSSFSWWAGWLTDDVAPSVIAPAQWFAGAGEPHGLVPDRWTRV
jgi:hypothetical protein